MDVRRGGVRGGGYLRAITVGNFSSVKVFTTREIVASDQASKGSLRESLSRVREIVEVVLPYPENWFWRVSTAVASERARLLGNE